MSYATHAVPTITSAGLSLPWMKQSARIIGESLMWLGGGVMFAATLYVLVALPGLLE